jgi:potassium channel LctB
MILALILATSLFLISVGSHLVILNAGHSLLEQNRSLLHKLGIALLVLFSHLTVAAFFAAGFWIGEELGLGGFRQADAMTAMDYFYFSLINVTTLGLADIFPTDHLRVLAGVEALTGFALISCSAQLFWSMMKKGDDHE